MFHVVCVVFLAVPWFNIVTPTEPPAAAPAPAACVIELSCAECVPDNMPRVTAPGTRAGAVRAAHGERVALSCGARGKFVAYPLRSALEAQCEAGLYRVRHDDQLRHLLDLGCQEDLFEDVLHEVEHCGPPLQGRAYLTQEAGGARHLATLCFDADAGVARRAHTAPALLLAAHRERAAPLSLLGSFNPLFDARTRRDAERLYGDDERLARRLRELLRPARVALAAQALTAGALLGAAYFDERDARVADFPSNKVAVWRSVADGNLRHVHADVARLLRAAGDELHVHAGTHGVLSLRAGATGVTDATGGARVELHLRAGRRFPVPRYVWTVVHARRRRRALAVVLLNDPLVAVSEIREAVFCASACARAEWLRDLRRARNYETPAAGLVFCCAVSNLTALVPEMPADLLADVLPGEEGMLLDPLQ